MISTRTRTPLDKPQPIVRPTTLAKLIDQQIAKAGHQQAHLNHLVVDENDRNSFSHSSGRISGRMRFSFKSNFNKKQKEEEEQVPFITRVHTNGKGELGKMEENTTVKLLSFNDINNIIINNYSALTGKRTNPKETLGQTQDSSSRVAPKPTKKGSRGSRKFKLNSHDKDEMDFVRNTIEGSVDPKSTTSTTKRSTSKIPNKYNIDYDHMLEDEYEIIQKVE